MQKEHEIRVFPSPDTLCKYLGREVVEPVARAIAEDMQRNGQLQDGVVAMDADGQFAIIIGNHRHRACQIAGLPFRARVLPAYPTEQEIIRYQVSENLQRRSLTPFERADYVEKYKKTLPRDATWEDVAAGLGMKVATVMLHVAPKRIPEALRPQCAGLGATITCLIGRMQKVSEMPRVVELARTGATKEQVERLIKQLARTQGRKPKWLEWRVNGRNIRIEVKPGEKGSDVITDLEEAIKRLRKYGDGEATGLGFVLA